jgi:hypothetical protein
MIRWTRVAVLIVCLFGGTALAQNPSAEIRETQVKLDELLLRLTDKHPDVIAARARLEELKRSQAPAYNALADQPYHVTLSEQQMLFTTPTVRAQIEGKSIVRTGDLRRASTRLTYTEDVRGAWVAHAGDYARTDTEYNCTTGGTRGPGWVDQDHPIGEAMTGPPGAHARTGPQRLQFHAVAPGTFDEAALDYVCRYKTPRHPEESP